MTQAFTFQIRCNLPLFFTLQLARIFRSKLVVHPRISRYQEVFPSTRQLDSLAVPSLPFSRRRGRSGETTHHSCFCNTTPTHLPPGHLVVWSSAPFVFVTILFVAFGWRKVNDFLESTNTPGVFAVGDCANMVNHPRPKAGVFAVRQVQQCSCSCSCSC